MKRLIIMLMLLCLGCQSTPKTDTVPVPTINLPDAGGDQPDAGVESPFINPINWKPFSDETFTEIGNDKCAMLYFRKADCVPCDQFEDEVLSHENVIYSLNSKFISVKIPHDKNAPRVWDSLEATYVVGHFPSVILLPQSMAGFGSVFEEVSLHSPSSFNMLLNSDEFSTCSI